MDMFPQALRNPFGENSCEEETQMLQTYYSEYYFDHTPFNPCSTNPDVYLVIGRKGTGKTSLAHYFTFQKQIPYARCIDVDEPEVYERVLSHVAESAATTPDLSMPRLVKIWTYLIWSMIFQEYCDEDPRIAEAYLFTGAKRTNRGKRLILDILKHLLARFLNDRDGRLTDDLEDYLESPAVEAGKEAVLRVVRKNPIILAIDSLEHYPLHETSLVTTTAALIESARKFNLIYAPRGVHVKVFIPAEIFPHLRESVVSNILKFVQNPLYLRWRPKDLIRLLCWRYYRYLERYDLLGHRRYRRDISWDKFPQVRDEVWIPYFGREVTNGGGLTEKTFPYVLRHTQMRPRQLVVLCNLIAKLSKERSTFPQLPPSTIVEAVKVAEVDLADEIINSYSRIYPNVARIIEGLVRAPALFKGRHLDRWAPRTASQWPNGSYSPYLFRQLVGELGIVGRVRKLDKQTGIVEADFEYVGRGRLALQPDDDCVIHPMFYQKLYTQMVSPPLIVYPFPDDAEMRETVYNSW